MENTEFSRRSLILPLCCFFSLSAAGMACAGSFWCPGGRGVRFLFLFTFLGALLAPGDSAWAVLVA